MMGLDVGCGDGYNTRLFAGRGARMYAVDIAPTFLRAARAAGRRQPVGIRYVQASGQELPFASGRFDFATAVMSLMDMPCHETALQECHRVLRPRGFLQFWITHPCFSPPHRRLVRSSHGRPSALEVARYFDRVDGEIDRWISPPHRPPSRQVFENSRCRDSTGLLPTG